MNDQKIWISNHIETNKFEGIEDLIQQLHVKISQYGDFQFTDDTWYCNYKHKDARAKSTFTIYFKYDSLKYKNLLKYYALLKRGAISKIQADVFYISKFLQYLDTYFPHLSLLEVNKLILMKYEKYLKENRKSIQSMHAHYNSLKNFFETLVPCGFPELPTVIPTKRINPFMNRYNPDDKKYIPIEVIRQFDKGMKDDSLDIPIEFRVAYWICRSFPNRSQEVLSCKLDALKTEYSYYVLFLPTWKQNGGYDIEELKALPIMNVGHGAYLISLIQKLKELNQSTFQTYDTLMDKDKDFLFLSRAFRFKKVNGELVTRFSINHQRFLSVLTASKFNQLLKQFAEILNIKDKEGKIYAPTSHQFRHNAITDRFYVGGYTEEQVSELSNHKNANMMGNYRHPFKDAMKKLLEEKKIIPENAPVEVKGKYWNLDEKTVQLLEKTKPDAYLTWEAGGEKGVGICSQISNCNPKGTAHHFECYDCDWFVPKSEYIEYYKKELGYWQKKMTQYADNPKWAAAFENAIGIVLRIERVIRICEYGIEQHREDIINKIISGELTGDVHTT